ncbi:MAG TPA: outer membrane beta-barrel protein [bacterium]|nr:outer membrane beta-barrel protein [bacterium]HPN29830.1 outer membrane beta-barrel protein [bacterium]
MKKLLIVVLILGLMASIVNAETKKGDKEIGVSGSYTKQSDADGGQYMIQGKYGYFFSTKSQIGVGATLFGTTGDDKFNIYGIDARYDYHFSVKSKTIPYIGGRVGTYIFKDDDYSSNSVQYGPQIGIKSFIAEKTTIYLEYQYNITKMKDQDDSTKINLLQIGLSTFF